MFSLDWLSSMFDVVNSVASAVDNVINELEKEDEAPTNSGILSSFINVYFIGLIHMMLCIFRLECHISTPDVSTPFGLLTAGTNVAVAPPPSEQSAADTPPPTLNHALTRDINVDEMTLWGHAVFRRSLCVACSSNALRLLPLKFLGVDTTYFATLAYVERKTGMSDLDASLVELEDNFDNAVNGGVTTEPSPLHVGSTTTLPNADNYSGCGSDSITPGEDFCSVIINPSLLRDAEEVCFGRAEKMHGVNVHVRNRLLNSAMVGESDDESSRCSDLPTASACALSEGWLQFLAVHSAELDTEGVGCRGMCFLGALEIYRDKDDAAWGKRFHMTGTTALSRTGGEGGSDGNSDSSGSYTKPIASSVVVRVLLSDKIRPGHIHISGGTRLTLGLTDFDTVTLTLLDPVDYPPCRPADVSTQLISWNILPGAAWSSNSDESHHFSAAQSERVCAEDVGNICHEFQAAMISARSSAMNRGSLIIPSSFIIPIMYTPHCPSKLCTRHMFISFASKREQDDRYGDSSQYTILDSSEAFISFVDDCCWTFRSHYATGRIQSPSHSIKLTVTLPSNVYISNISSGDHGRGVSVLGGKQWPSFRDLVGLEAAKSSLLRDVLYSFLPVAVLHRLCNDGAMLNGPIGSLVIGPRGSGKSALLHGLCQVLAHHRSTIVKNVHIDCQNLQSMKIERINQVLSDAFEQCRLHAPSLLCLDNLHTICGNESEDSDGPNSPDTTLLARYEKIAVHLAALIHSSKVTNDECCREAYGLYRAYSTQQPVANTSGGCKSSTRISNVLKPGITDLDSRVVERALVNTVYVLATATHARNMHPRLLNMLSIGRKIISLPSMRDAQSRLAILRHAVAATYGAKLRLCDTQSILGEKHLTTPQSLLEMSEIEAIAKLTEGYAPSDLCSLAKRAVSIAMKAQPRRIPIHQRRPERLEVSFEHIDTACRTFLATSSASLNLSPNNTAITFASIGGHNAIKNTLINTFQRPVMYKHLFKRSCTRLPRGVMLYGPPGNGKTVLAQAAGNSCGLAFMSVRGPELLDKYIGSSEKAVRSLFERARSIGRPCLIFFDEFESLGARRGQDTTGVTDRVVNQLLTFLDGVEDTLGSSEVGGQIYIVVATSRPDMVDPALLRPGRIETHAYVGYPNQQEQREIFETLLRGVRCSDGVDGALDHICSHQKARQFTGADIKGIVNNAFLMAAQDYIEGSLSLSYDVDEITTRQQQNEGLDSDASSHQGTMDDVTIFPYHVMSAFQSTKPSISPSDLAYYDSLYRQFKNGATNSSEIGKRVALV
jgi:SpoVK/Ycf46/Vps4 family AAA+-type ATPase